jgi:hypothetical protein
MNPGMIEEPASERVLSGALDSYVQVPCIRSVGQQMLDRFLKDLLSSCGHYEIILA